MVHDETLGCRRDHGGGGDVGCGMGLGGARDRVPDLGVARGSWLGWDAYIKVQATQGKRPECSGEVEKGRRSWSVMDAK